MATTLSFFLISYCDFEFRKRIIAASSLWQLKCVLLAVSGCQRLKQKVCSWGGGGGIALWLHTEFQGRNYFELEHRSVDRIEESESFLERGRSGLVFEH